MSTDNATIDQIPIIGQSLKYTAEPSRDRAFWKQNSWQASRSGHLRAQGFACETLMGHMPAHDLVRPTERPADRVRFSPRKADVFFFWFHDNVITYDQSSLNWIVQLLCCRQSNCVWNSFNTEYNSVLMKQ